MPTFVCGLSWHRKTRCIVDMAESFVFKISAQALVVR